MRLRNYGLAFALVLILLLIRGYMRLVQPAIWAEDGVWLGSVLEHGIPEILRAEFGYHLILQKTIVGLVTLFPVPWWPVAVTLICFLFYAALVATFANETYAWILPSRSDRLWICALFAFLPGLPEVLGNAANLGWVFCFFTALIYLKDPKDHPSLLEAVVVALSIGSAGQTAILAPALAYRLFLYFEQGGPRALLKPGIRRYLVILLIQLIVVVLNVHARTGNAQYDSTREVSKILFSWLNGTAQEMMLRPLLNLHIPYVLMRVAPAVVWMLAALVTFFWLFLVRKADRWQRLPHFMVLCWSFAILLVCVVRGWGLDFYGSGAFEEDSFQSRNSYLLAPGAVLLWVLLIRGRLTRHGIAIFSMLYVYWSLTTGLVLGSYRGYFEWEPFVAPLRASMKTGCPPEVKIPLSPPGWFMDYHSPKACIREPHAPPV
ncbi:MAG: hypothetical protein ACXWPM_05535 [Bdellovibrionota bacterium]